jgi:hypothetical protein
MDPSKHIGKHTSLLYLKSLNCNENKIFNTLLVEDLGDGFDSNYELGTEDEDSSSTHSSDSEGLVLDKENIAPQYFPAEKYRQLLQESTLAHLAVQEERASIEFGLQRVTEQLANLDVEFEEAKTNWEEQDADKDAHVVVVANAENLTSHVFLSQNKQFLDAIDGKTGSPMRTL